jgi:adenylate cyclase
MAADEAGTLARLKALQNDLIGPLVAGLHGRIVKLMGDGALVEFPSVVEAVQCAVEVQRRLVEHQGELPEDQRIALRIGVNLGDIIIEDNDIHGDGVNVAARLEALAEPGGILVSRTVRDKCRTS